MFMTVHLITTLTHPEENVSKHPQYVSKHTVWFPCSPNPKQHVIQSPFFY